MKTSFIPFGTQYYRADTPLREDWDRDLENIKNYGFNTVKLFALWRWNNPKEGSYYFEDLDELMNLALKNNLKVIINILFDLAPAWFFRKYPDSVMITCDGRRVEPRVVAHRSIGGAPGPCYNHKDGIRIRNEFLAEAVKRYQNHPALYCWDLWNEPELTCGILRQPVQSDMVCYCDSCKRRFIVWLSGKYGSIDNLNSCWHRNYNGWEEIELPRSGDVFVDMIDWRVFFSYTLTEELRERIGVVKRLDSMTPVMVHTVPMPYFNAVNSCNNDYEFADICDMFGNSIGSHPFAAAFNTSCAGGKTVINSEIHALGGYSYNRPGIPSFEDIKSHIFVPLARGIKGFIYWQYRPETLGRESPAWGLSKMDGGHTECLGYNSVIGRMLQENAEIINTVMPLPSEIAVINSFKGQVFDWCASGSVDTYTGSVIGLFMALYDANLNADIIGLENLDEGKLKKYKVVFLPFPYYIDIKTTALLKQWVWDGGCLISEAFFGAVLAENGLHSREVPGYGFTEVFGLREGLTTTVSSFNNAYAVDYLEKVPLCPVSLHIQENLGTVHRGDVVEAHFFMEELITGNARVLGCFDDGVNALTVNDYGKGKAVMIGSLIGFPYYKNASPETSQLIAGLAGMAGINSYARVEGGKARADILKNGRNDAILVINGSNTKTVELKVQFFPDLGDKSELINMISQIRTHLKKTLEGYCATISLGPGGHEVFMIL